MELDERRVTDDKPCYECLLFDLDDTLYPLSSGLAAACTKNIGDYVVERLGVEKNKAPDLCRELYKDYGTTMAGLRAVGYEFDNDDYHSFVHGRLPYENLNPDLVLKNLLLSMPQRKIIFTNGDKVHAAKVLSRLGLEDCFEGVICFETLNSQPRGSENSNGRDIPPDAKPKTPIVCKPSKEAIEQAIPPDANPKALIVFKPSKEAIEQSIPPDAKPETPIVCKPSKEAIGQSIPPDTKPETPIVCKPSKEAIEQAICLANADPQRTIFFDDSPRNIAAGKRAGLHTVLVGTPIRTEGADFALESIHNIKEALPEIWEEGKSSNDVVHTRTYSIETYVTA